MKYAFNEKETIGLGQNYAITGLPTMTLVKLVDRD